METNTALVGTNGIIKLHTVTDVDMNFSLIVRPGHAEGQDSVRFNKALNDFSTFKFRVLIIHIFNRMKNFANRLQKFGFARMLSS